MSVIDIRRQNNKRLQDIKGLIYKEKGSILINPAREFIADLDSLPYPNYEVFDTFNGTMDAYPLITSRGCPYSCIFCCASLVSGTKWRARKPSCVIEELEWAKSKYNTSTFMVLDDNFTLDVKRAKEICRLLIEHNINMAWSCENGIRADRLDDELVALMKESGCTNVCLGIESVDPEIFPIVKKGESLDDIRHAIDILKKHKLSSAAFFIVGFPGDNLKKVKSSVKLVKKLGLSSASWSNLIPYPKTEVSEWVNHNAKMIRDYTGTYMHGPNVVFETEDFSEKERIYAHYLVRVKFKAWGILLDPKKPFICNAFYVLRLIMKYDPENLLSHLVFALGRIRSVLRLYLFRHWTTV